MVKIFDSNCLFYLVECCDTFKIIPKSQNNFFARNFGPYFGNAFYKSGFVNGAPFYRPIGNGNRWMARYLPLEAYSIAAWVFGNDLDGDPGLAPDLKEWKTFYFAGNVKCPQMTTKVYYKKYPKANYEEEDVIVQCI